MAKVLLILPHLPQRMGAPYLGQQYIAASLMTAGHTVKCLDMSALLYRGTDEDAVAEAERFGPDIVGMTLFTYNAARGYRLAHKLRHVARLILAGGPHATVMPEEVVANGFDAAVVGEGELVIRKIATMVDAPRNLIDDLEGRLSTLAGVVTKAGAGPGSGFIDDLDELPFPYLSYPAFDPTAYSPLGTISAGGLMTSRGCPARCTFCANYVTGRGYRFRSTENIIAEMVALQKAHQLSNFPFWDDAFTARRPRLNELCDGILASPELEGATWTCITPGNMVKPFDLERMREAGCVAINFGLESGDYNVLKQIQKGQRPEQVKAAVKAAKSAGMTTIVNFMFGFPGEGLVELKNTLDLMVDLSDYTDFFNNRGVLVPFPGTSIYDEHVAAYGFAGWWLDPKNVKDEPNLFGLDVDAAFKALEDDPTLELDFFRYSDPVREMIASCVAFKARHNRRTLDRMSSGSTRQAA
jgi:radical SAM superfamily enzyme YgiQ (UPF0313 family)